VEAMPDKKDLRHASSTELAQYFVLATDEMLELQPLFFLPRGHAHAMHINALPLIPVKGHRPLAVRRSLYLNVDCPG
jgi:hypothetical protein